MRAIGDICLFISRIVRKNYKVVQTTTSLGVFSILRDGIFIMIAHIFKKKTIVFFRGWNEDIAQKIEKRYLSIFRFLFFRTDCSIVLSIKFKNQLQKWGYSNHIYVETTIVDYDLLKNISIKDVEKSIPITMQL